MCVNLIINYAVQQYMEFNCHVTTTIARRASSRPRADRRRNKVAESVQTNLACSRQVSANLTEN